MRTRLFLLFAFAAVTVLTNAASAGNIAHGVEVVVIDPGHGGNDPGAHYGGTSEKDLTLKVALKLGKMIEEGMPGVKCEAQRKAGYAALRAAKLPVAIKVKVDMTIADPKGEGSMAPHGANGKGLEYFGAGSDLPERMLTTFSAGASSVRC